MISASEKNKNKMDITGQYFCSFNIKGQPFNEVFKVVLEASVSLLDKNGIVLKRHISKVPGRQLVIQNIMKEKLEKGIDLSDIAFDKQMDYEYNDTTPDLKKSRYSDVTLNTMSLRTGNENNHQKKAESKRGTNLQVKDIHIVQKIRQDCFWVHNPENLVGNSEKNDNASNNVSQQKTNTRQISTQNTGSPRTKCTNVWVPPTPLEIDKPSSQNKCQTVEAEEANHAENVIGQEIKKECVESDYELTNAANPNVMEAKLLPLEEPLPKTGSVENSVPNEFEHCLNHNKTGAAENSLATIITRNSRGPTGTINTKSDSYSQTAFDFDMDSKLSESPLRVGQKSEECQAEHVRDVSKEKSSYFPNCDEGDIINSLKTAFETNSHQNVLQTDNDMNDSVTVNDLDKTVEENRCQKIETITAEDFNDIGQSDESKPVLLNRLIGAGQPSGMSDNFNTDEQIYAEQTFETSSRYDNEQDRHSLSDDTMSSQSSIAINTDNADNIDLAEDTDSEDEEFFVFCDEPGDVYEITLGEVNNAETQTHIEETGDLEGQDKQMYSCCKKRKYKPRLPERNDHAYSHKKKRKTKQKSRVKRGNDGKASLLDCYVSVEQMSIKGEKPMSTTSKHKNLKAVDRRSSADLVDEQNKPESDKHLNIQSKLSDLKEQTTVDTAELSQVNNDCKYKSEIGYDCKDGIREGNTADHSHFDKETNDDSGRRNRRRRCNYNIDYKQLDDLYASIGEEDDEALTESQIKSEDGRTESQENSENLESDWTEVKTECDPDSDSENFESTTKATRKADSDYEPESVDSGKKAKVVRKVDPDYDPSDLSDMSDDGEEDDHDSPVSEIDSEFEGKVAEMMRKKQERKSETQQFQVNLSAHADKYEIVKFISKEQRNRGRPLEEISHDSFSCKLCQSYQTVDENCMSIHIGQHIHGKLGCDLCGKEFSSLNNKARHYKNDHPETVRTKTSATMCEMCGLACSDSNVWRRHMYNTHKVPSFECRFCGSDSKVRYPTQKELQKHMNEEHTDKLFSCDKCGKFFLARAKYKVHKATCKAETGEEPPNICHICSEILDTKTNLTRHVKRVHQKEKCFKCEICSYVTLFQKNMKRHKAIHLGLYV